MTCSSLTLTNKCHLIYRVTLVVLDLGLVDSYLLSSPGWWAANVATYCPSRKG